MRLAREHHPDVVPHRSLTTRVDRQRRAAEDRFRAAFDQADVGMAIFALEGKDVGRLQSANMAYSELLGRDLDEIIGRNFEHWTHPDDLPESSEDPIGLLATHAAASGCGFVICPSGRGRQPPLSNR